MFKARVSILLEPNEDQLKIIENSVKYYNDKTSQIKDSNEKTTEPRSYYVL